MGAELSQREEKELHMAISIIKAVLISVKPHAYKPRNLSFTEFQTGDSSRDAHCRRDQRNVEKILLGRISPERRFF